MGHNYSFEWDKRYCYPNSLVLKNKFNILDGLELELAEKEYTSLSIAEVKVRCRLKTARLKRYIIY